MRGLFPLPPLRVETMERLLKRYSTRLPILEQHITSLTGGYVDFTLKLLQEVKSIIESKWSGSRPIDTGASWTLILEALRGSAELGRMTDDFFNVVTEDPGGGDLADYFVQEMRQVLNSSDPSKQITETVAVTIDGVVEKRQGMRCSRED